MRPFSVLASLCTAVLFVTGFALHTPSPSARSAAAQTGTLQVTVVDGSNQQPLPGASVGIRSLQRGAKTDSSGVARFENVPAGTFVVRARVVGFQPGQDTVTVRNGQTTEVTLELSAGPAQASESTVIEVPNSEVIQFEQTTGVPSPSRARMLMAPPPDFNREQYARIEESDFVQAGDDPLSTFAIDVDGASYTNVRRFIRDGERPPVDAVRIEEMLNYFTYNYPGPAADADAPFASSMEVGTAPWAPEHRLVHVGIQGRRIESENRPPSNLVFLLDVSGSMDSPDKLGFLKRGMSMLTENLRDEDRVAVVVYAGASGVALPSTPGTEKDSILSALQQLRAGGSTAGAAGIQKAYQVAEENFIEDGVNRVILATDGDFNVGVSSTGALTRLIEEKRESDTFLTVLGFGRGNLQDETMEQLANKGNGAYFYIDTVAEARRVLVDQIGSTLQTIAKDVKIQVEFNPAEVAAYRLIGYENRALADRDFADDTKDAGELGAGHSVTVLYEVIPAGEDASVAQETPDLRYQRPGGLTDAAASGEMLTLKLRYKEPDGDTSRLLTMPLNAGVSETLSDDFSFSAAVAGFGMLLRKSDYAADLTLDRVRELAEAGRGDDEDGTRAGFISLIEEARPLLSEPTPSEAAGSGQ